MNVVADRFEVERVAGQGGMGTVFRARDRRTERVVALKIVEPDFANARFEREAELLSELADSAIVRYVAHGSLADGRMYLAMEWLEGTPLDERLAATPLSVDDCLAVGTRLARALASAHAKGVVHRDVKPANVILREGRAANATLVDFGIARTKDKKHAMTGTGVVIGTPAYMAPEQARAQRVDARADVFSLGCVLFECLCGRPAFVGEHVVAVLAKILLESPPRVGALRSDVPPALDALIAQMLAKEADARPADGSAVLQRLEAILAGDAAVPGETSVAAAVGAAESRLATVLLARIEDEVPGHDTTLANLTAEGAIADAGQRFDVPMTALANGTLVGVVVASEAANDAAERAARCALVMRDGAPGTAIVLATGRAVVGRDLPVGTAIDEAARILSRSGDVAGVFVDEQTAALVESRFELARSGGRIEITAERKVGARVRTIGGREAPCVGRERELSMLDATYDECIDEPIAQAVLVIAPPGLGKSRLRRELVDRLEKRDAPPNVWLGLADPVMAQAPLALVSDVLRRVLGIAEDEALEARREKVRGRLQDERVAAFLGEIAGAPFDDSLDPALRAARNNPGLLAAQVEESFVAFARAESEKTPLVIVLEDVHWADAASLALVRRLLERLTSARLFVLALARPSIDETHPDLWQGLRCQRVSLQPLLKKAAVKIARALLGESAEVEAIVDRAEGNALFVEELARARLDGGSSTDLPLTVVAAAEARIATLSTEARVVLRAGAVFGERFWRGGVARLIGSQAASSLDAHLDALERAEAVTRSAQSRFRDETELVFRHALVRDAAYAMLTEHDRKLAHALAAEWLETRIDDAVLLAHHFEVADRPRDAARWQVQAAEDALAANAFDTVLVHAKRAEELGIEGNLAGRVHLARAQVTLWRGANPAAAEDAIAAMSLLDRASAAWFTALGIAAAAVGKLERHDDLVALARTLEATPATNEESGRTRAIARIRTAMQLYYLGEPELGDELVEGCEDEPGANGDPHVRTWMADLRFERAFASGFPVHPRVILEAADLASSLGDLRNAMIQSGNYCMTLLAIGARDNAANAAMEMAKRMAFDQTDFLGFVSTLVDSVASAMRGDTRAYEAASELALTRNVRAGIANRLWLAMMLFEGGHVERASDVCAQVFDRSITAPPFRSIAVAVALRIAVRHGDLERVRVLVDELDASIHRGVAVWGRAFTDVARIEGHEALGHADAARAALEFGVAHLRKCADIVEEYRHSFLRDRPDCAELVAMARERGIIVE